MELRPGQPVDPGGDQAANMRTVGCGGGGRRGHASTPWALSSPLLHCATAQLSPSVTPMFRVHIPVPPSSDAIPPRHCGLLAEHSAPHIVSSVNDVGTAETGELAKTAAAELLAAMGAVRRAARHAARSLADAV